MGAELDPSLFGRQPDVTGTILQQIADFRAINRKGESMDSLELERRSDLLLRDPFYTRLVAWILYPLAPEENRRFLDETRTMRFDQIMQDDEFELASTVGGIGGEYRFQFSSKGREGEQGMNLKLEVPAPEFPPSFPEEQKEVVIGVYAAAYALGMYPFYADFLKRHPQDHQE